MLSPRPARSQEIPNNPTEEDSIGHNHSQPTIHSSETRVARKRDSVFTPYPTGALLRSLAFPGWGQAYNKKYIKSGFVAIGEGLIIYYLIKNWNKADKFQNDFYNANQRNLGAPGIPYDINMNPTTTDYWDVKRVDAFHKWRKYTDERNKYSWFLAATIFVSMFDAYVDAHLAFFKKEMSEELKTDKDGLISIQFTYRF